MKVLIWVTLDFVNQVVVDDYEELLIPDERHRI